MGINLIIIATYYVESIVNWRVNQFMPFITKLNVSWHKK